MKRLFAPWRWLYATKDKRQDVCPFCNAAQTTDRKEHFVLEKNDDVVVILNKYPYNTAHILISPVVHVAHLEDMTAAARSAMMESAAHWVQRVREVFKSQGFNVGFNLGSASGGSIPQHVHMHVIPRWEGDTNFLATIGETKIVASDLTAVYAQLMNH